MHRGVVVTVAAVASVLVVQVQAAHAGPQDRTLEAWRAYVSATEARIERELRASGAFLASDFSPDRHDIRSAIHRGAIPISALSAVDASGRTLSAPGGTIAHWRGAVLVPGTSLDELLHRLQHPNERGPYPDDVLAWRVMERAEGRLKVAMRIRRSSIVRVTYDTEHHAEYRRHGRTRASSRSVSMKVSEVVDAGTPRERLVPEGQDRGFLWRMNSCWRYEQVNEGVIVEVESLTLSRGVPFGLGVLLDPVIERVARESVTRTLSSVRRLYAGLGSRGAHHESAWPARPGS